jgi:phosphate-selective porin OprO/OprP
MTNTTKTMSIDQGGWGAWEVGLRYSDLDLTDGLIDGGEMDILSLGFHWWLTPTFNFNMNYRYITLDRFGIEGTSSGVMTRALLLLEEVNPVRIYGRLFRPGYRHHWRNCES